MPNFDNRIAKIEQQLGAPGCVCGDRRERVVILSELRDLATPQELEDFHQLVGWICPMHGQSHSLVALRLRLSRPAPRWPALTHQEGPHGY